MSVSRGVCLGGMVYSALLDKIAHSETHQCVFAHVVAEDELSCKTLSLTIYRPIN